MNKGIEDRLISFNTAKLAKEKGFGIRCPYMYDRHDEIQHTPSIKQKLISGRYENLKTPPQLFAPTQAFLQKWLREEHFIHITIMYFSGESRLPMNKEDNYTILVDLIRPIHVAKDDLAEDGFKTYEDALERGLELVLKEIKL